MKCPLDDNLIYDKAITIYKLGYGLYYCRECIKNKLLVCKICGLFKVIGDDVKMIDDPYRGFHPIKDHIFIRVTDDVLKKYLKFTSGVYFDYSEDNQICIEI